VKALDGYVLIGPLCYQGKEGCESPLCTRFVERLDSGSYEVGPCRGYHCSYCDEPCSSQGHRCDAANAILGAAEQALRDEGTIT
jgi:hypothetical protein